MAERSRAPHGVDAQDDVWLPKSVGLKNVRRYVATGFPRSGAPHVYGPGLGCETLFANARAGRRELERFGAPFVFLVQTLNRARSALTPTARALLDGRASIRPEDLARRPDVEARLLTLFEPGWDDLVQSDDLAEDPVAPWFDALDALLEAEQLVVDLGRDRYRLASEAEATPRPIRRRAPPAAARAHPARLRSLVDGFYRRARRRSDYFAGLATLRDLDSREPLRWLADVAAMATFVRYDFESGRAVVLEAAVALGARLMPRSCSCLRDRLGHSRSGLRSRARSALRRPDGRPGRPRSSRCASARSARRDFPVSAG